MEDIDLTESETPSHSSGKGKWLLGGLLVAVLIGGGFMLAQDGGDAAWESDPGELKKASEVSPPVAVGKASPMVDGRSQDVRGVIKAAEEATLGSRMTARIVAMPYRVGARFSQGATLVSLDCSQLRAQLAAANAATAAYQTTYETNVELDQYKAIGTSEVAVSKANVGKARAEGAAIAAQMGDCAIRAPFSGTVVEEIAHRGEVAASGQPLLKLQSGGALEAELIVPSDWLTWVKPGLEFGFKIDETGESVTGVVKRLGASVDPVSKTIRITGDLLPGQGTVLPGMSGTAHFKRPSPNPTPKTSGRTASDGAAGST